MSRRGRHAIGRPSLALRRSGEYSFTIGPENAGTDKPDPSGHPGSLCKFAAYPEIISDPHSYTRYAVRMMIRQAG